MAMTAETEAVVGDQEQVAPQATRRRRRFPGALAALALALGMFAAVGVANASPAAAAGPYIGSNSGGAWVRSCASTTCFQKTWLTNGTPVNMQCWVDRQWVYPPNSDYASNRWFRIGGYEGYVHSSLVEAQRSVPRC